MGKGERVLWRKCRAESNRAWKPGEELLLHPMGSREPVRILEDDGARRSTSKGRGI